MKTRFLLLILWKQLPLLLLHFQHIFQFSSCMFSPHCNFYIHEFLDHKLEHLQYRDHTSDNKDQNGGFLGGISDMIECWHYTGEHLVGKQKYNCSLYIHKSQGWILDRLDIWSTFYYTYYSMAGFVGIEYLVGSLLLPLYIFGKYGQIQDFLGIKYTVSSINYKTSLKRKINMYLILVDKIDL